VGLDALKFLQETISDLENENENRRFAISELYTKDQDKEDIQRESEIITENEMRIAHLKFGISSMATGLFLHGKLSLPEAAKLCDLTTHDFCRFLKEKCSEILAELDKEEDDKIYNLQDYRILALEQKILPQQRILEVFRENLSLSEFIAWNAPKLSIELCKEIHDYILKKIDKHDNKNNVYTEEISIRDTSVVEELAKEKEQKPMWKQAQEQANEHMQKKDFNVDHVQQIVKNIRQEQNEKDNKNE